MLSQLADPKDVFNLLEAVKTKESPTLDTVAIGKLQLFQNEGAKANGERCLRPDLLIGEVNGGNKADNPLYIFFHGAGSGEASQALVGQSLFFCVTFLVPGVSFRVKPSDSRSLLQQYGWPKISTMKSIRGWNFIMNIGYCFLQKHEEKNSQKD